jgi:hypothetical protein
MSKMKQVYIIYIIIYKFNYFQNQIYYYFKDPSEFAVYIVKENTCLMFDCQAMDGELNINHVTYFPDFDIVKNSDSVYNSPNVIF